MLTDSISFSCFQRSFFFLFLSAGLAGSVFYCCSQLVAPSMVFLDYLYSLICSEIRSQNNLEPEIETEIHFLFSCDQLSTLRGKWFSIIKKPDNFNLLDEGEKLNIVLNMHENCKPTAQYITDAYCVRNKILNQM